MLSVAVFKVQRKKGFLKVGFLKKKKIQQKNTEKKMPSLEAETRRLEPCLAANDASTSILIFHTHCVYIGVFSPHFSRNQYTGLDLIRP